MNTTNLLVKGTIDDLDGDRTKVKVWIKDHTSIYRWDIEVTTRDFEVNLDLSSLSEGIYYVIAQGYDANNNVSDAVSVRFYYQPGGGSTSAPQVIITTPTQNATVTINEFEVSGTISDPEGDQDHITYWVIRDSDSTEVIDPKNISAAGTTFSFYPDFTDFPSGSYTIYIYGVDEALNVGNTVSVTINYQPDYSYTNILLNADFSSFIDNYSGTYDSMYSVNLYLNNTDGDWLENWYIFIDPDYDFENLITISMDGNSIRYSSTVNDNDAEGNQKLYISQGIANNHTVTPKTKFHIKFKINSATVGTTNPAQGELKIFYNYINNPDYYIASFSSLHGDENSKMKSNLIVDQIYESTLSFVYDCGIPENTQISSIYLFVNCAYFDVTIYEIAIYEEP